MLRLGTRAASMRTSCPLELRTSSRSPRTADTEFGTSLMSSERRSAVTVMTSSWVAPGRLSCPNAGAARAERTARVRGARRAERGGRSIGSLLVVCCWAPGDIWCHAARDELAAPAVEAPRADRLVGFVAAHLHLGAFVETLALLVVADHHGRLAAAAADGLQLLERVGDRQQLHRARESLAAEIRPQPVGDHGHVLLVREAVQLPRLLGREELRLVDEDARRALGERLLERGLRRERAHLALHAQARGDDALAGAVVDRGGVDEDLLPALLVVVRDLQEDRGLARVHRGVAEIEFGHDGKKGGRSRPFPWCDYRLLAVFHFGAAAQVHD